MIFSVSGLIRRGWWPCEILGAGDLKFCMGPCFTYAHSVQEYRGLIWERFERVVQPSMYLFQYLSMSTISLWV